MGSKFEQGTIKSANMAEVVNTQEELVLSKFNSLDFKFQIMQEQHNNLMAFIKDPFISHTHASNHMNTSQIN